MIGSSTPLHTPRKDYQSVPDYSFAARSKKASSSVFGGNYKNILYKYLDHPSENSDDIYMETPEFTVIYDAYPKARIHLLIIPKRSFLACDGIDHLRPDNLQCITELHHLARHIAESPAIEKAMHEHARSDKSDRTYVVRKERKGKEKEREGEKDCKDSDRVLTKEKVTQNLKNK